MKSPIIPWLAYAATILHALIVGLSFLFAKMALEYASPLDTLAYRFAVSFGLLCIPAALGWLKLNYLGKPVGKLLLLATAYPLGFFLFQTFGLRLSTSSEAGMLFSLGPIVTTILASLILKEGTTPLQKLFILVSVSGVVSIFAFQSGDGMTGGATGIVLLLLSTLAISFYSVLTRSLLRSFTTAEILFLLQGIGFVSFIGWAVARHALSGTLEQLAAPLSNNSFILDILYLGILASLVTSLTSIYALSRISASITSVFSNLSTVVSIAAGMVLLGESMTAASLIGSVLIIAGAVGTAVFGRRSAAMKKRNDSTINTEAKGAESL
ncbi:DMT family transporter [Paenibacillus pasadenensis]|uniref:DMT family transporter n=1 Tax=Paenibacillus pasadenensis TaxID=217090 RepID=UPI00203F6678|nr:DMT family transporter [Paenibacillus pasadenensis]MCM3747069.1 DMT family transporter [Paenibacillus pasadenensis]